MKRFSQAVLLLLALGLLAGCASKQELTDSCLRGVVLWVDREPSISEDNAIACLYRCQKAIEASPENMELYIAAGKIHWLYGVKDVACQEFALALAGGTPWAFEKYCNPDGTPKDIPLNPEYWLDQACISDVEKLGSQSVDPKICRYAMEENPNNASSAYRYGVVLRAAGRMEDACKAFKRASDLGQRGPFRKYCNSDGSPIK